MYFLKTPVVVGLVLLAFIVIMPNLFAQDDLYVNKNTSILTASADNYHPNINQIVKITINFKSPGNFKEGKFNLGFGNVEGMEIVSGDNLYKGSLHKSQNVIMVVYVKFLKKKVYNFSARFFKETIVNLTFYVDGAYRESEQVKKIKKDITKLNTAIGDYKNKSINIPFNLIRSSLNYRFSNDKTIVTYNKYEKSILSELEKQNETYYDNLKVEMDSLTQLAVRLYKTISVQKYLPPPPDEGGGGTLEPVWQSQEIVALSPTLSVTDIRAIKNHSTPYYYFLMDPASGQIIPLSNMRVEPSTLGSIHEYADHRFKFIANNNIDTGHFYATNTLDGSPVNLPVKVFGNFTFECYTDEPNCIVELYDVVDNNETKIGSMFTDFQGTFSFTNVNIEKFKILVKGQSPHIIVYNTRTSQTSGTICTDTHRSSDYGNFCSDFISESTNKMIYRVNNFNDFYGVSYIISSLEEGFNFDPTLPSPLRVWYDLNAPDTAASQYQQNYKWIYVNGHLKVADEYDRDLLLHEFGHFYMDVKAGWPPYTPAYRHFFDSPSSEIEAFVEGWADFFSGLIRNNPSYHDYNTSDVGGPIDFNIESPGFNSVVPDGNKIEGDIAAVLWDLYDTGSNESWDQLSGLSNQVLDVMQSQTIYGHTPYTIKEFAELWASKRYPDMRGLCTHYGIQIPEFQVHITGISPVLPEQANYSAEAAMQMMLSYMGVPTTQSAIYSASGGHNSLPLNSASVLTGISNLTNSNYTWSMVKNTDFQTVADYMVKWIGYNFENHPVAPHSPTHLPCLTPFNSSYNDWRIINGFEVSSDPWQGGTSYTGSYTIYGFWVTTPNSNEGGQIAPVPINNKIDSFPYDESANSGETAAVNPNLPGGYLGGGETFYSVQSFQNYFTPINGYYETVLEPPKNTSKPNLGESYVINMDKAENTIQNVISVLEDKFRYHKKIKDIIKQIDSYKNQVVTDLISGKEYIIITIGKGNKTYLGIILDQTSRQISEMNIPDVPVDFVLLTESDVIKILIKNKILKGKDIKSVSSKPVFLKDYCVNKFYPLWEISKDSLKYFVNQEGKFVNVNLPKKDEQISNEEILPGETELIQNYPNPFNPSTVISFSIDNYSFVDLTIYDILGREVKVLINGNKPAGKYSVNFNASNLPSGVYIYRLNAGTKTFVKKMIFTK